ncbi:hypothetical protein H5410_050307 [Solanum commersonii]|uniref:DUF7588 domain-containing protein n=1 Tax=Solanum commersonii TaxID=4109 RepID=A0A9J5WXH3_SOLCO|nr:hypothetical protein H5410_050307 [Solanum commersonii]
MVSKWYENDPAKARIAKDFERKKWKLFRKWFFKNFTKEEQYDFQEEFYKDPRLQNDTASVIAQDVNYN